MSGSRRHRPRGWVRHYGGMLSPGAATAMRTLLERDAGRRLRRVGATAGDRALRARRRPRMRALLAAPGAKLSWREVAAPPPPAPLGAVVHPIAASTCDMDCPVVHGATQILLPLHLGHECVAEVLSVGERVQSVRPGDRVIVPFEINCGACEPCRSGHTASCTSVPPVSMYGFGLAAGHWGGAFSDELAVPYADAMLVALPDGIDPVAAASVADNVCDAYRHIGPHLPALLAQDPEAEVLIFAAHRPSSLFTPSCPLYTGMIALAMGARNVVFADSRPWVRAHAERLGMRALHPRALRRRPPFPLVADVSVDGLPRALAAAAPDGVCSSSGGLHRSAQIPMLQMYIRNATLHIGRAHVRALMPAVLDLMARGDLHPEQITTTVAALDDAPRVLREHFLSGDSVKTVLTA
ncbi:MAG TPA: alcohol dehydrogenase catalytic domain-containing protein [Solirubrobacteraceae bacterium]|nr:alcohol dehydrogenase catalytic domain-containing protein [Solirubrobacteraceae bacterium]